MKIPLCKETLSIEQMHGRIDDLEYHVLLADALVERFQEWKALKIIGIAIFYRIEKHENITMWYHYYISSSEITSEQFAVAVRGHWAIENSCSGFWMW